MDLLRQLRWFFFITLYQWCFITSHHIIFENIGQMATGVTYIHAKITINFSAIEEHYDAYINAINEIKLAAKDHVLRPIKVQQANMNKKELDVISHTLLTLKLTNHEALEKIFKWRADSATNLLIKTNTLRASLPQPLVKTNRIISKRGIKEKLGNVTMEFVKDKVAETLIKQVRFTRFIPGVALGLGALGTFMGLYNKRQTDQLKKTLNEVTDSHNQLIEVVQDNTKQIEEIRKDQLELVGYLIHATVWDPAVIGAELMALEEELRDRIEVAIHAIQMAQLRRLSVDLIPTGQLISLYNKISKQAELIGHTLLTNAPSDLYQLEISYFYDGINVHLLIHVPSVAKDSLLRLLKLHPFPLPVNSNFSVIPSVKNDILAISSGFDRYSAQISAIDLLSCHSVNNIYLCEKSGVLSKNLNGTCMGALYIQNFESAQELCDLEIQTSKEIVRPLLRNQFLIFSPAPQTSFISCRNGTQSEKYVPQGISKIDVSEGCKANLLEHVLIPDSAIQLDTDIVHYEWNFDSRTKLPFMDTELEDHMTELLQSGITSPTINDLQMLKVKRSKLNYLWYFISFVMSILACALITVLIMVLWCRYPLSRIPGVGPCLAALHIVSQIRVHSYAPPQRSSNPTPMLRRRPQALSPQEPLEMEELSPALQQVQ